jgi:hypothetical protein
VTKFRTLLEFVDAALEPTDLLAAVLEVDPPLEFVVALGEVELELPAGLAAVPLLLCAPPAVADPLAVEPVLDALLEDGELALVVAPLGPLVVLGDPVPVVTGPPVPVALGPAVPLMPVPAAGDEVPLAVPVPVPVLPAVVLVEPSS